MKKGLNIENTRRLFAAAERDIDLPLLTGVVSGLRAAESITRNGHVASVSVHEATCGGRGEVFPGGGNG